MPITGASGSHLTDPEVFLSPSSALSTWDGILVGGRRVN